MVPLVELVHLAGNSIADGIGTSGFNGKSGRNGTTNGRGTAGGNGTPDYYQRKLQISFADMTIPPPPSLLRKRWGDIQYCILYTLGKSLQSNCVASKGVKVRRVRTNS